eukprot:gnl/Dysnectes_brevis/558_a616_4803.p1 GENE.gnl/Dysnectes_brevis/558_a616_4803~~gnl/Dysnectes_brevis/558_a616_4803.p1  ORF type:complete len:207 (+),score=51.72 gnl/Dysnectes_brevis/558_a616_4803:116-736(+)
MAFGIKTNPGPVGMFGLGISLFLYGLTFMGILPSNITLMSAFWLGGVAQFVTGLMEFWTGDAFGCAFFVIMGAFWAALVAAQQLDNTDILVETAQMGWFILFMFLFLVFMTIGSFAPKVTRVNRVLLFPLTLFFLLWGLRCLIGVIPLKLIGALGVICALISLYHSMAGVLNHHRLFDRDIIPKGPRMEDDQSTRTEKIYTVKARN